MKLAIACLFMLLIALSGCNDNTIAAKLYSKCDPRNKCIHQVKEVTNFKWDNVYVFDVGASLEEIERTLGFRYAQWKDVGERIIFVENGRVVYQEEYFPYPEHIEKGTSFFELNIAPYVGQYSTATFSVAKQQNERGVLYYVVTPIR